MNKKTFVRVAIILAGSAVLFACAPMVSGVMNASVDENTVYEKTAKYFGVTRENISVSSIEKGMLATTYHVRRAGKFYNCTIYYGAVDCKQPGASNDVDMAVTSRQQIVVDPMMTPTQAQSRLNQLGYPVGSPDGIFGKKSVDQLKLFQKSRGLSASGKLDSPTIEALR